MKLDIRKRKYEKIPYDLLLEADPNRELVDRYLREGQLFLAYLGEELIASILVQDLGEDQLEIKNISVKKEYQNKKYGRKMLDYITDYARNQGYEKLIIATGNSSLGQLALYQKSGFSMERIDKGFFLENYDEEIIENGIRCQDKIILGKPLK